MFPPGRARLATRPARTGSATATMTIGIVPVAFFAARVAGYVDATMRSTLSATSSAAKSWLRSILPSDRRHSIAVFTPST